MKRLLVALLLVVILSLTFATPAMAWGPGDMPESGKKGLDNAFIKMVTGCLGSAASWFNSTALANGIIPHAGYGPVIARWIIDYFLAP